VSGASVNTSIIGDNDSNDQQNKNTTGLVIAVAIFIASPITALSAIITWFIFSWGRVKRSVIASFLGLYSLIAIFFIIPISTSFVNSWTVTFPKILSQEIEPGAGIMTMLGQQVFLALPLGVIAGLAYASWRWFTRAVWDETEFRITPWELFNKKKNIKDIQEDKNGPLNGTTLGITEFGRKIVQTDKEASAHTLVVGASGSGKTTTLMSKARDSIRLGQGIVFIDLKGGNDVPLILSKFAERYDRKFTHWLMQSKTEKYNGPDILGPAYYDPLARGEATRRKDLLIASRNWSEEHYKIQASSYLQMLFSVLIGNPKKDTSTFSDVVSLLDPRQLQERAIPLGSNAAYHDIVAGIDALNDTKISKTKLDAIDGLKSQLEVILHSVAGPWLQVDKTENKHNINLKEAAHNGEIIVFSLDSSNYQELSALVANLIIQDLKTVTSELRDDPTRKPFQVFIDEFSAIGSDNIIGLINKSRDANMPVTLSTQALGDLRKVDPTFLDQVLGIVNSFIIHRANTEDDAKVYAGLTGTEFRKKFRQSVEHSTNLFGLGRGSGTGTGTVEDVEEFRVMPNEIQELRMGEMVYVTKSPS
jgi:type IV secretory pathway TraG/TraD family ATPase VirD4